MKSHRALRSKFACCTCSVCEYVAVVDWQQVISFAIVGTAAILLVRRRFKRRTFEWDTARHSCCSAVTNKSGQGSIVFRARKGERPEVRVKM